MPSLEYQHQSEDIWKQHEAGQIDDNKFYELLGRLKTEEINKHASRNSLGRIHVSSKDRIENDIWEYERRMRETREKEARNKSLTPLERYKEDIPETLARYRTESNSYRRTANILQMLIIAGSVLATSATSAVGFGVWDGLRWVAPAISITVAISAGFTAYFKFKERSFNLQQTADAIEQEYVAVGLGIGYYKGKQLDEALKLFAERVEVLKDEQKKRQQQLEQPPDIKHG